MSRLARSRFLKCSYSSEASSPFILYSMFHLLATIYSSVTVCCNLCDTQWQCYERPFRDEWCSLSLPRSLLLYLSLCHTLIHLLSFLNLGALAGRGADLIREWAAWIGGICVASALAPGWPNAFSGNPSFSVALSDISSGLSSQPHTQSRAQCQAMDYLTEWTVWRLPIFPGNYTTCWLQARGCLPSSGLREVRIHVVSDQLCQSPQVSDPSREHQPSRKKTVREHEQRQRPPVILAGNVLRCFNTWFGCLVRTQVQFYPSPSALVSFASSSYYC